MKKFNLLLKRVAQRKIYLVAALSMLVSVVAPVVSNIGQASAVNFTTRSLSLSNNTNVSSLATTVYTFSVIVPTGGTTALRGVEVGFCTTALYGSCTQPTGMVVAGATMGTTSPAGGGTIAKADGVALNSALASSGTGSRVRFQWAADQTLTLPATVTFIFNAIQNPTTAGTFYARIGFFGAGDTTYTTVTDKGTVAQSVQALQNVSFKVAETLSFCVGTLANGSFPYASFTTATLAANSTCTDSAGTSLSLGTAPNTTTACITPVSAHTSTCNDSGTGTDRYGYAMVQSNAGNGVVVGYRPNSNGATFVNKTLEVASSTCAGFTSAQRTDGCFNPVNEDAAIAIGNVAPFLTTAAPEQFGMAVPRKNAQGRGTSNLTPTTSATGYGFTGEVTGGTACTTGAAAGQDCWNWNRTGAGTTIASSTAGTNSTIDYEALQLFFAAKPGTTTPTGSFAVDVDYYSVPTF